MLIVLRQNGGFKEIKSRIHNTERESLKNLTLIGQIQSKQGVDTTGKRLNEFELMDDRGIVNDQKLIREEKQKISFFYLPILEQLFASIYT